MHHTDPEHEYADDALTRSTGKLVAALREAPQHGWLVADIKRDWAVVFGPHG